MTAGGWPGEDQSLGGSGYAPAPLESPTLPGSYANSSAGRKGAGLSKVRLGAHRPGLPHHLTPAGVAQLSQPPRVMRVLWACRGMWDVR